MFFNERKQKQIPRIPPSDLYSLYYNFTKINNKSQIKKFALLKTAKTAFWRFL